METQKSHPFGEKLRLHRSRKQGLTQARLAHAMGYDEAVVIRMAQGKKDLTGPSGRDRVLSIIKILHEEGVLSTLDEANALLTAASLPPLYAGLPQEAAMMRFLDPIPIPISMTVTVPPMHFVPPAPLTTIIGRKPEINDVMRLLDSARLVTLTGAGGSGKTRFALEVASLICSSFPHGACFVSLAPASQPEHIAPIIIATMGITPIQDLPAHETIVRFLRDKAMLLVLDNFEHVIEAATFVTDLLAAAPALKILVTSREALHLNGEHLYPIEPLNSSDATQLFITRAQAVWPGFALTLTDRFTLEEVCRRLDGLPLAIELASARIRQFSPQQLLARLTMPDVQGSSGLNLLSQGPRDLPVRQQTLRETIGWSYRLLQTEEQRLLRVLAIFAGGAAIQQLVHIVGGSELDVTDRVYSLVSKNLLRVDANPNREARFSMLELIRAFALDKLIEAGEFSATQRAHAEAFVLLAESAKPHLLGAMPNTQQPWIERMQREADNIRAMMTWCLSSDGEPVFGLRLISALTWYLRAQTHVWHQEGFKWVTQLRHLKLPNAPPAVWGWTNMMVGFPPVHGIESLNASIESLQYAQLSEEEDCIANSMISVGIDLNHQHSDGRGTPLIEEGLALARKTGYSFLVSYGLHYLAQARRDYEDRPDDALHLLEERIAMCEAANHRMILAPSMHMAAGCALYQLDFVKTWAFIQKASENTNLRGWDGCDQYRYSVEAMLGMGDIERAMLFAQEGYELVSELNNLPTTAFWLALQAKVAVTANALESAFSLLGQSHIAYLSTPGNIGGIIDLLENVYVTPSYILGVGACLACAQSDFPLAARLFGAFQSVRQAHRVPREPNFEFWQTPYSNKAKTELGELAYETAYSDGRAMTLQQALIAAVTQNN